MYVHSSVHFPFKLSFDGGSSDYSYLVWMVGSPALSHTGHEGMQVYFKQT